MSRRFASVSWVLSILIVVALALAIACSSPNRNAPGTAPTEQEPVASTKSALPPSKPAALLPVKRAAVEEHIPKPPETPVSAPDAPATRAVEPTPSETAPSLLKMMQDAETRRLEYEQSLPRLASERDAAAEVVVRRQKDLLAYKNPFLPRPQLAPDEAEEIKGMGGAERANWAEGRHAEAKALFEAAQKVYDDAKASPPN